MKERINRSFRVVFMIDSLLRDCWYSRECLISNSEHLLLVCDASRWYHGFASCTVVSCWKRRFVDPCRVHKFFLHIVRATVETAEIEHATLVFGER